jgi:hypothetical protein
MQQTISSMLYVTVDERHDFEDNITSIEQLNFISRNTRHPQARTQSSVIKDYILSPETYRIP